MNTTPPSEFSVIGLCGEFRKFGAHEWHGPCPLCRGGDDRFVIFTDRQFPSWTWFCRKCHPESGWIDELNPRLKEPLSPEKAMQYAREREESLKREIARAEDALKELQTTQLWIKYHAQLTEDARWLWEERGVPMVFQEIWGLGYDPDRLLFAHGTEFRTPTLTIPIVEPVTKNVINIRHRLLRPLIPNDKYRPEKSGLPAPLFVADTDLPIANRTMIVEGEIKSMVSYITADDPELQVVGIPGKNMPEWMYKKFAEADPIYLCFDPDASREARASAARLGLSRCRLIELPDKIDDLILRHRLGKDWMRRTLAQAVRL
jgi:hypothetical protein